MSARAALDAARAVFQPSLGRPPAQATTTPTWVDVDEALVSPTGRADAMWSATEQVLQLVVGHAQLTGQALISEARRQQVLTLGDAHALVALLGWRDRMQDRATTDLAAASLTAPPGEDERGVAREAWLALEHAVDRPVTAGIGTFQAAPPTSYAPTHASPPPSAGEPANASWDGGSSSVYEPARRTRSWYRTPAFLGGMVALLLMIVAGAWYLIDQQNHRDFENGLAAYERGAREVARTSFARAAQNDPDDARPLLFLGRISREENDLARARRFLEAAVRLDPENATAQRELASALLADGQPELARRFYVRAIELNPTDRLSQGFLGCALMRLGRYDEARRWGDRAGPGEWTPCLNAPFPMLPPMSPPVLAVPPR